MRVRQFAVLAAAFMSSALATHGEASAIEFQIFGIREDRTRTTVSSNATMPPYGATLHREVVRTIGQHFLPFRLIAPAQLIVVFAVNRRGEIVHLSVSPKSRAKPIDDYMLAMVRLASRRFPPPPADLAGDVLAFAIPIRLPASPGEE